jgi:hypothetical protein
MIRNIIDQGNYFKKNFIKFDYFQDENKYLEIF